MKVFTDKLGYEQRKLMNVNKLLFPWKLVHIQLGTISDNVRIGDSYQSAKFYTNQSSLRTGAQKALPK